MNINNKNTYIKLIENIIDNHKSADINFAFTRYGKYNFSFDFETYNKFKELISNLLFKENWNEKFSENYVSEKIMNIIKNAINEKSKISIQDKFTNLINEYEHYSAPCYVLLPLEGLILNIPEFVVGKIRIKKLTEEYLSVIALKILNPKKEDSANYGIIKRISGEILKFKDKICAEFEVVAEMEKAYELAIDETNRALEILRFSIPWLYTTELNFKIGFEGILLKDETSSLSSCPSLESILFHQKAQGGYMSLIIDSIYIEKIQNLGIFIISDILKKNNFSKFEEAILRGIHWLSNALDSFNDIENSFLNMVICLETFFTPPDREPISNSIAEGVAFILGDNLQTRKEIKKIIKNFYQKRSSISHGSKKTILKIERDELLQYSMLVTKWMILKYDAFHSIKDVTQWIEDQKFS